MTTILHVKACIDVARTAPDHLVTSNGSKLPLWAVSDDDLRYIAAAMADELIAKAAKQRAAASDIPDDVLRSRALYRQIEPLPERPADDHGGAYIGLIRGKTPANEATSVFHLEDERAPGKMAAKVGERS